MNLEQAAINYLKEVQEQFNSGHAREHAYRPALQRLMENFEDTAAINDPARSQHGMPDFVFLKKSNQKIIKGYAEAKDITVSLDKTEKTDQMDRYHGYANLFLTDYLEFRFFENGQKYKTISLGKVENGKLSLTPENSEALVREIQNFLESTPEQIKSGKRLAEIMGAKARRIRDNVTIFLAKEDERNTEIEKMYQMMKELLVHDLSPEKFADMYAQTLVYGLFVARYNDKTPTFSRQEARDLVPKSNPFLRKFFDHIAGTEFDDRLAKIVDELCEVFSVSNVKQIISKHLKLIEFGDGQGDEKDPIIHFYEDFLKEYDPAERKKMGAYYTPIPVVKFMVKQVDEILKKEFGLKKGLADTSKIEHTTTNLQDGKKSRHQIHKVQILDPAVGTATFLNEVIKFIHQSFQGQEGRWPSYAEQDLLPRLNGFELMMAPYTIAHLKLGMTLQETGLKDFNKRLGVYLTNTLEEGIPAQNNLFTYGLAEAVTNESSEAAKIKHEKPIMVIIGNPPYSGVSSNNTAYANALVDKYKVEPGGKVKLNERKHWLNDDYVKFISFAEDMIAKNGEGIIAMITNHGFLDNPTFRGMRWHLTQTFDQIKIIDLHGNAKKKEVSPDGSKDENVFDIMQGVAIIIGIKFKNSKKQNAKVEVADIYGKRQLKFNELLKNELKFKQIKLDPKLYYLVDKNIEGKAEYEKGFSVADLFSANTTGIVTMGDAFIIADTKRQLESRLQNFFNQEISEQELKSKYKLGKNYSGWVLENKKAIKFNSERIIKLSYRPFDDKWTYFDNKLVWRTRTKTMQHFTPETNLGLVYKLGNAEENSASVHATNTIIDFRSWSRPGMQGGDYVSPLYLYHEDGTKTPNFNLDELKKLKLNLKDSYEPEDILDYIYAVLHSPSYRKKYKEFLKIDFPRVPVPKDDAEFNKFKQFGTKLRQLHLMQDSSLEDYITTYPEPGDDVVDKLKFEGGKVWINSEQYFGGVPEVAWNFYIGGYQPAQKWLKDRKGRKLSSEDLDHYQKIIKILVETDKLMTQIG
jgi:predicted helicase